MKTQIWIAASVYALVAIVRRRLKLDVSLCTLMQVFSVTVFEKASIESMILQTPDGSGTVMGDTSLIYSVIDRTVVVGLAKLDNMHVCVNHAIGAGS